MNKTEICNYALTMIGESMITDASDPQDEQGRLISLLYDQTLYEVLMSRDFACSKKRLAISASSSDPDFGYETQYPLPGDWLRMAKRRDWVFNGTQITEYPVTVNDNFDTPIEDWIIEGANLMTSSTDSDDEIQIVYIRQMNSSTDAGLLKPHVVKLVAHELGYKILLKRSQNLKLKQEFKILQLDPARTDAWGIEAMNCYRQEANNQWQKANR